MATTIKTILMKAKKIILEKGWAKRAFQKSTGEVCATKAISLAAQNYDTFSDMAKHRFKKYIPKNSFHYSIINFNDDKKTTLKDVLKVFDRAIANKEKV